MYRGRKRPRAFFRHECDTFWRPHFSIWRLKKKIQSPVGACLKKLISDPVNPKFGWKFRKISVSNGKAFFPSLQPFILSGGSKNLRDGGRLIMRQQSGN